VLKVGVAPRREPPGVDVRARLQRSATPAEVQQRLEQALQTPLRGPPNVTLEELDGDEVVVRIGATPARSSDGPNLASEVLNAISPLTARSPAPS
jgi:hypothetical protein